MVIEKESGHTNRNKRKLLSVRDMILDRKWPLAKIQAIVARGGGLPDPDAPAVAECTQYWCTVETSAEDIEACRQRARVEIQAQTAASDFPGLMNLTGQQSRGQSALTVDQVQAIADSTSNPAGAYGKVLY